MSKARKKLKKKFGGIGLQIASLSSDLVGYKFARADALHMALVWVLVAFLGRHVHMVKDVYGLALGATFCALMYAIFKLMLPMVLFVRVVDLLRFRYAYYLLCVAGAVSIESAGAFWGLFSSLNINSLGITLTAAVVLANMVFMRYGGRMLLVGSYLIAGGLCACGALGVLALLLAWGVRYLMNYKLTYSLESSVKDVEDPSSGYLVDTRTIRSNSGLARHCRISCALALFAGMGVGTCLRIASMGAGISKGAAIKAVGMASVADVKLLLGMNSLVPLLLAVALLVISLGFIRPATDVFERLRGRMMLVFGSALAVSLGWSVGIIGRLPPFSQLDKIGIVPDIIIAFTLILSGSVYLVELGCRELAAINSDYSPSARPDLLSRRVRRFRVILFSLAIIGIVVVMPLVLG